MTRTFRRVALLSPYSLYVPGGVQEQVLSMSRALAHHDLEVTVLTPGPARGALDTPAEVVALGRARSVPANGSRAPLALRARDQRDALEALTRRSVDVVHLHEPFAPRLGWGVVEAHRSALLATFHRSGVGLDVRLAGPWLRRRARQLDVVTAVSRSAAELAEHYGLHPEVLYNGFDLERFTEFARVRHEQSTLVFVGRLEARKGVDTVIDAVLEHNRVARAGWRLVVLGDGPEGSSLRRRAKGSPDIEFLGRVDDETKRRWWRSADVALAPSRYGESFGLVILEAMAAGTRIVASDIPGYREAAGGHAVLARPDDVAAWITAISHALATRDSQTLDAARRHAQGWSMNGLVERYLELYDVAIRRRAALR
ncbi:MAG: glycosyltransferase family 4 protein [Acidimicrobiaceae bacterium]|nr:glycosyltransferase family 4 protein [Acidimicrobiaceae bacterium]